VSKSVSKGIEKEKRITRITLTMELATVPERNKELRRPPQSMNAALPSHRGQLRLRQDGDDLEYQYRR
jgi:hypothetical protein